MNQTPRNRSYTWVSALLQDRELTASQKLIAMVIGTYVNDHGQGSYPSQETLAELASCKRRTVMRSTAILEKRGWIARGEHKGFGQEWASRTYTTTWPNWLHVEQGCATESPPSDNDVPQSHHLDNEVVPQSHNPEKKDVPESHPSRAEDVPQSHHLEPEGSATESPPSKGCAAESQPSIYESWEPDRLVLDSYRIRFGPNAEIKDHHIAEYRLYARAKGFDTKERIDKSFMTWVLIEKQREQRYGFKESYDERPGAERKRSRFQLETPLTMEEQLKRAGWTE